MEKKFIVPAVTFILPLLMFIVFFVMFLTSSSAQETAIGLRTAVSVVISFLILLSGISCYKAKGPRMGSVVRSTFLLIFALLTFWKVDSLPGFILLAASIALGLLAALGKYPVGSEGESQTSHSS